MIVDGEHNTMGEDCWCNPKIEVMENGNKVIIHITVPENDARTSYGDFFDKAVIALGFSSAMLPGTEAETKMLKRISDLFWLVRKLSVAMDFVYERLPPDFPCLPVSYDEIKQRMKELK